MGILLKLGTIDSYKPANQFMLFHFNFLEVSHFVLHPKISVHSYVKQSIKD